MRASSAAFVSSRPSCPSPRRSRRFAALAIGASAFLLGGVVLAADEPAAKLDAPPAADAAAAPDGATGPGALQSAEPDQASKAGAASSTHSDRPQEAGAKSHKGGKEHKSGATPDSAPTDAPPTTTQVQPEERVCHLEQAPGSRVRKTVCVTAAEQNASSKDAQEYLKRAYEDSLHPTPNPSTFTGAR
jgi:hypothetical protein